MRVGILTFHSQLNYGGVLQCWALQQALTRLLNEERGVRSDERGMRNEVVVVDRWLTPDNRQLEGPFGHAGVKGWCEIVLKSLLGCDTWKQALRHWRTRRFVRALNLTPYHFYNWSDLSSQPQPFNLNLDTLVVGSDQVWHGGDWGWPTPEPYLLKGAPRVKAIAYAASFGMKSLPSEYDYAEGFKRFTAISVREREGIGLVESQGSQAVHVVDPTLLLEPAEWFKMGAWKKVPRRIVCYFLEQNIADMARVIEPWARQNRCTVEIVCDGISRAFPKTPSELVARLMSMMRSLFVRSRVRVCSAYGPREFVKAFARAEMCITDSFHAVMFSSIYDCNVRFLRPQAEWRRAMFARIEEFAKTSVDGPFVCDDLNAALGSLERGEKMLFRQHVIQKRREVSAAWLMEALK